MKTLLKLFLGVFAILVVIGACFGDAPASQAVASLPEVKSLRDELSGYPEYSIQLLGLREDQGKYFHQFKAVWMDPAAAADARVAFRVTEWKEIDSGQYSREKSDAGKVIFAKRANGDVDSTAIKPAELYANNVRPQQNYNNNNGGISAGDVAAYMLMAEILDEAGDALEHGHKYRKYDSRYHTYPTNTYRSTTAPAAAPTKPGFNDRVRGRMNNPGVAATPTTATTSKAAPATAAKPSFNDRVRGRMNNPGVASTPVTATASKAAPAAPAASFNDRVRSRMNNPGATASKPSTSSSGTPSYSAPSRRSSTPSYSTPSRSSGSSWGSSSRSSGSSRSSWGGSSRSSGRRRH